MGLAGVRSVFTKNRSFGSRDSNVRNYGVDKRKWISVRSYLCGDEFNSVIAQEDSASVRSSEATVTQPMTEEWGCEVEVQSEENEHKVTVAEETPNSPTKFSSQDCAAIEDNAAAVVIQSAVRRFLVKCRARVVKDTDAKENVTGGKQSPSRESIATSIEAQTGGSVEAVAVREEIPFQHRMQQHKSRTNIWKLKEDWDDSTVSSNISKLRIQNRLEATTRRERALAYSFSQQLRICSKKKSSRSDTTETNMGWSWLERWMATRIPEASSVDDRMSSRLEPISSDRRPIIIKRNFDAPGEEESCGSNEVSLGVGVDILTITAPNATEISKPIKSTLKATKTGPKRKNTANPRYSKASKKSLREAEKERRHKQTRHGCASTEAKCKDVASELPS